MTRAERAAMDVYPPKTKKIIQFLPKDWNKPYRDAFRKGYEQAEKETIQRIKELLKVRIVERTERCQEDWSNRQKDRVNIRNDEDGDIILVLEKLGEE